MKKVLAGVGLAALTALIIVLAATLGGGASAKPKPSAKPKLHTAVAHLSAETAAHTFVSFADSKLQGGVTVYAIKCVNVAERGRAARVPNGSTSRYGCIAVLRQGTSSKCYGFVFTLLPGKQPSHVQGSPVPARYCTGA